MRLLRRRVSQDIEERLAADRRLAARYDDLLARVGTADRALRQAETEGRPIPGTHALVVALDRALTEALQAAEAAERAAMGPATYPPADGSAQDVRAAEIARRKARATSAVRPWSDEVDRLRTAREKHRLSYRVGRHLTAPS
ncbi:MAG TPA: plectin [Streptosporangiaceae bacterium]|nr:plectin [Streptosporangiaceae bacterium]